jgi:hypothetical protein
VKAPLTDKSGAAAMRRPSSLAGTARRDEGGARFRDLLRKKFEHKTGEGPRGARGSSDAPDAGGQLPPGLAIPHSFASHLRPEGPARPIRPDSPPTLSSPPGASASAASADRLLLGVGPGGAEARLAIGHGPLAGSEIRVREGAGGLDAAVLTKSESSRQTLISAMEEVARRLQGKGHVLRLVAVAHQPRAAGNSADDRSDSGDDDGAR